MLLPAQDEEGDTAVNMAIANPQRFVLKPQREGGGNNVYGQEIANTLSAIKNSPERTSYILMDLIEPHVQPNYLLRAGQGKPQLVYAVGELGIFGYILRFVARSTLSHGLSFTGGHLARVKDQTM